MGVYLRSRLQDMQETRERRGVAQSGSARALGAWGRGFKSLHSDHFLQAKPFMAPWSRGQDTALSRRNHEFDSRSGHHGE